MNAKALNQLVDILKLEKLDEHLYRGQSEITDWGRVYGGQVIGQALSAAKQQVAAHAEGTAPRVQLHLRVNQNIETHSLLRAMQFHVKTRQMGIWDQYGE